jgi:hypothetical protein
MEMTARRRPLLLALTTVPFALAALPMALRRLLRRRPVGRRASTVEPATRRGPTIRVMPLQEDDIRPGRELAG